MNSAHQISAYPTTGQEILPWRDLYRQEMDCQIIHDSLHRRDGWTQPYRLRIAEVVVGYGALAIGGPWQGTPALFEFYVVPPHRDRSFDLFTALLAAARPATIETQSNDPFLTPMLHSFAESVVTESILFQDQRTTAHSSHGAEFRRATPQDAGRRFAHQAEPPGDWVLTVEGKIAATGGLLFHYNRPYGDIFMEVAEPFRRRGFGTYLVQELKRVCYDQGSRPAARCNPANVASRRTLQKAGLVPCGCILKGAVPHPNATERARDAR